MTPSPTILIEQTGISECGPCECCGNLSMHAWGLVTVGGSATAAYFVHWTQGNPADGARFEVVLGDWSEAATSEDRMVIALDCRWMPPGPQFMIVDADPSPSAPIRDLAAHALARETVVNTSMATLTFAILDAIWLQDQRLADFTTPRQS
ncbi:MAG: hypothetical protein KGS45_07405 [Planctomycetes bacterium]|nr:hypothetical protein [Planctomycetota bacterium]